MSNHYDKTCNPALATSADAKTVLATSADATPPVVLATSADATTPAMPVASKDEEKAASEIARNVLANDALARWDRVNTAAPPFPDPRCSWPVAVKKAKRAYFQAQATLWEARSEPCVLFTDTSRRRRNPLARAVWRLHANCIQLLETVAIPVDCSDPEYYHVTDEIYRWVKSVEFRREKLIEMMAL
jgi:hypothetical protein